LARSVKALRLNRFLHGLTMPAQRQQFLANESLCLQQATLTQEERDLVQERNWQGLIRYGVIFFLLEKLGAVVGVSNLHIYAAMRGQSLDSFMQTRNAPGALYSVAGTAQHAPPWANNNPTA
jgi:gallate dioxygenase